MAVQLRGREGAVAEEVLDRAQVGAAFEQMGGERMAQTMWMCENAAQGRRVQPLASRREEQRILGTCRELGTRPVQVLRDQMTRLLAERDDPFLAALAAHVQLL